MNKLTTESVFDQLLSSFSAHIARIVGVQLSHIYINEHQWDYTILYMYSNTDSCHPIDVPKYVYCTRMIMCCSNWTLKKMYLKNFKDFSSTNQS